MILMIGLVLLDKFADWEGNIHFELISVNTTNVTAATGSIPISHIPIPISQVADIRNLEILGYD